MFHSSAKEVKTAHIVSDVSTLRRRSAASHKVLSSVLILGTHTNIGYRPATKHGVTQPVLRRSSRATLRPTEMSTVNPHPSRQLSLTPLRGSLNARSSG